MKKVNIEKIMITEDDGDVNVKMLLWELAMIANMYFKLNMYQLLPQAIFHPCRQCMKTWRGWSHHLE